MEDGFDDITYLRELAERGELHAVLTEEIGMKLGHAKKFAHYVSSVAAG